MREFRFHGERPQWDASLVVKVEELIDIAIGEQGKNVVDFKMLQTVLYILARHLRILEQMVEVRTHVEEHAEEDIDVRQTKQKAKSKDIQDKTKSGEKAPVSVDEYLSSEENYENVAIERRKKEGKGRGCLRENKDRKSRDDTYDDSFRDDESTGSEEKKAKNVARTPYKDEDEGTLKKDQKGRKERRKDRTEETVKHDKEKDEGSGRKEKSRARDDDDGKAKISEKIKKGDKTKSEIDDKKGQVSREEGLSVGADKKKGKDRAGVSGYKDGEEEGLQKSQAAKHKNKKGKGKESEQKTEERDRSDHRASDEVEGFIEKGGQKGKSKEGDTSGKKRKRKDSKDEREEKRLSSEEREVRGKKGKGRHYMGSIEVVTQQQFRALERAVYELQARATMPTPRMPDNKRLMSDIAQGNATLTDVMEAAQLQARIVATERAIERMAQLVSLLAASGELPAEILSTFTELEADVANMTDKATAMGATTKSPKEPGRKSLGLGTLSTLSTLSSTKAEAAAAMKRGIMGTSGRVATDAKEMEGDTKDGKEGKKGKKKGPMQVLEKGQQTLEIEKEQQQTQGVEEGRSLIIEVHDEGVSEKQREPFAMPSLASTSIGRSVLSKRTIGSTGCVTAQELQDALRALREDFLKNVGNITARANAAAEAAVGIAKDVGSKLTRAVTLNDRVSTLYSLVNDYTEQLHGFDAGVNSQMLSFQQQLNCIKGDLHEGLHELHNITNNAETAAVLELTEQYQVVAAELDDTLHSHKKLLNNQDFLTSEVKDIAACIEELREQKADKDEVLDGLRDKADLTRLDGLLTLDAFNKLYEELELRMQMCYDKFRSQDAVWMTAVQEFNEVISAKATVAQMSRVQDDAQQQFDQLNRKALLLKRVLGDPKAAVLTRKLTKGAMCAACAQAALMEVSDAGRVDPPRLPAFRPRPPGADDACLREGAPPLPKLPPYEDETRRPHICKRWCGGSHTLLSSAVTRENAPHYTARATGHSRRYMGAGTDNKMYMLVDQCQPCEECNVVEKIPGETEEPSLHPGAGDQGDGPTVVTGLEAHRVTIVADADIQLMRDALARKRRGLERRRSSGGVRGPLDRETVPEMDIREDYEDVVPRKATDIGVVVKGHITVLGDDTSPVHCVPGRQDHERTRRSSLAQDRIREQFETQMPNATEDDFISKAIAALSEL